MRFGYPLAFWGLLAVPLVVALFVVANKAASKGRRLLGEGPVIEKQFAKSSKAKILASQILIVVAVVFMVAALVRPQFGGKSVLVKRKGVDILFLVDVSRSMSAKDTSPDRLSRSKAELMRLLDVLHGDRVGIIEFSGAAFVQCPLTTDYSAARLFLKSVQIGDIPQPGTALGKAFELAAKVLKDGGTEGASKVAVVITDGEDFDPDTEAKFEALKDMGVKVFTVGVGSAAGEPIPVGDKLGYLKDNGKTVMSRRNDALLRKLAEESGGKYYNLQEGSDLTELVNDLKRLKKGDIKNRLYTQYDERFAYPLWLALFALIGAWVLDERAGSGLGLKDIFRRRRR